MSKFTIRFLTRDQCHLCDEARPAVVWAAKKAGVDILEVDVESSDDFLARYGMRIPVVLGPDEAVLAEGVVERRRLTRRLRNLG